MTMRFSTNNVVATTDTAAEVLWEFFSFMTSASPTGPGWTSVGESDGTSGGMGVTGLITAYTDLTDSDAWFVLQSPEVDGYRQILMHRNVGDAASAGEGHFLYNKDGDYEGGSSSSLPTATNSQEVYTNAYWITNGTYQYCADDEAPYGWYFFGYTTTTNEGCAAMIPVEAQSGDDDPYVLFAADTGFSYVDMNTVSSLSTNPNPKCWTPDGNNWSGVAGTLYTFFTTITITVGPWGNQASTFSLPIPFMTRSADTYIFYKGMSTFVSWKSTNLSDRIVLDSKSKVITEDVFLDWDGMTNPGA